MIRVEHGDCLAVLPALAAEGVLVDSVVCDPPYHLTNRTPDVKWCRECHRTLGGSDGKPAACPRCGGVLENQRSQGNRGFMGKQWDGGDVAFRVETWAAVMAVMKPGAHLIAFSGSRTYHRMACAIEDAGFEIRDQLQWITGSGFPKSLNLGGGWGTALKPSHEPLCLAQKPYTIEREWVTIGRDIERLWNLLWLTLPANIARQFSALNPAACGVVVSDFAQCCVDQQSNIQDGLSGLTDTSQFVSALISSLSTVSSWNATLGESYRVASTSTTSTESRATIDLRTLRFCLSKITLESIILAHKSGQWSNVDACNAGRLFNANVAARRATLELSAVESATDWDAVNCPDAGEAFLKHEPIVLARKPFRGTVAGNVLAHGVGGLNIDGCRIAGEPWSRDNTCGDAKTYDGWGMQPSVKANESGGRWPANVLHDGSDEVVAAFPVTSGGKRSTLTSKPGSVFGGGHGLPVHTGEYGYDEPPGSAARFFYSSKADADDRCGSKHPTVKPTDLMAYLCRLVTPAGGLVLDPFAGSGSTGMACLREGFDAILIEREAEYVADIRRRIAHVSGLDAPLFGAVA